MKKQGKGATAASDRKRRKQAEDLEGGSERSVPGLARGLAVMEFLARRIVGQHHPPQCGRKVAAEVDSPGQ